ncbi:MAG: NAD(P)H-dependent oxidoreductase, partial [Bacteroidota bacterium]
MKDKKILIINGHPDPKSFNFSLASAYETGARRSDAEVDIIHLKDLT